MIATIVNMVAVLIGGSVGLLLKKGLPEKLSDSIMKGLGLCTLYLGISGSLKGQNSLILIISMVVGIVIGEILDLDDKVNRLGKFVEKKFQKEGNTKVSIAEGFVSASLLFCVGAMAIVGSLQAGLAGDYEMLYNKSMLDGVAAIIFASSFGVGVLLSAFFVFAYQGTITLLAQWIAPFLTDVAIAEMTCVGSVIIIGIALNMIGLTKFKLMNYVPAVFIPIILCKFM